MENSSKLLKLAVSFEEKYHSETFPSEQNIKVRDLYSDLPKADPLVATPSIIAFRAKELLNEVSNFLEKYNSKIEFNIKTKSKMPETSAGRIMTHLNNALNNLVHAKQLLK